MASSPASPLEYNEHTGEPFIRLPHPYKNIILTPPRLSDVAALMAVLNDPKVYLTLEGPPNPYLESDAMAQLARITKECAESLREFHEAEEARRAGDTSRQFVSSHPLRYIREVREDGTDIFLGDLRITRCNYRDIENVAEKARMAEANQAREAGDAEIVWCVAGAHMRLISYIASLCWLGPRYPRKLAPWQGNHDCRTRDRHATLDDSPDERTLDTRRDVRREHGKR